MIATVPTLFTEVHIPNTLLTGLGEALEHPRQEKAAEEIECFISALVHLAAAYYMQKKGQQQKHLRLLRQEEWARPAELKPIPTDEETPPSPPGKPHKTTKAKPESKTPAKTKSKTGTEPAKKRATRPKKTKSEPEPDPDQNAEPEDDLTPLIAGMLLKPSADETYLNGPYLEQLRKKHKVRASVLAFHTGLTFGELSNYEKQACSIVPKTLLQKFSTGLNLSASELGKLQQPTN